MLRNHLDLEEGQVYLFKDEKYRFELGSDYGQHERIDGVLDQGIPKPFAFTRWPPADLSLGQLPNTIYLSAEEVDKLITDQELTEI